jgi:uncharacterized Ntn-hydrolase superfamily protein
MTFSILAHCSRTQRIGIAIATYSLAVGIYCDGIKSGVGVAITQATPRHRNNQMALRLLETGYTPQSVIEALKADDPDHAYRQIGIIDRFGAAAAYTGDAVRSKKAWGGEVVGPGMISFGNGLRGPHVAEAVRDAFLENEADTLEERLLRGIEAGRDAGGQGNAERHFPEQSAALIVFGQNVYPDTQLRVDLHETAVAELRRLFTTYLPYQKYYRDRDVRPAEALRQDLFVKSLQQA